MRKSGLTLWFAVLALVLGSRAVRAQPAKDAVELEERVSVGAETPSLSPPPQLGDLDGKPILRVEVETVGKRWPQKATLPSIAPGEPLSAAVVRRAMRELSEGGAFANVAAEVRPEGDGVVLVVVAVPRRVIANVTVSGAALDVRETLLEAGLSNDGEITEAGLARATDRIRDYYARRGFDRATVSIDHTDTDDPRRVVLRVEIEPGEPRSITQRVFVIEPHLDREVGDLKKEYAVGAGDRADETTLVEADKALVNELREAGFYRADVRHATKTVGERTYLYVYLLTGPRFLPAFYGNRAFDADELTEALALDDRTDARPAELAERLRKHYVERGFLDVSITAGERGEEGDAVHYLAFDIVEGVQVSVERRVFVCLAKGEDPDDIGEEIDSILEEELPGADFLSPPDPNVTDQTLGPTEGSSRRATPRRLNPASTYSPEAYERALRHVSDLFFSRGYLNAVVGPVTVVRQRCKRSSPAGRCILEEPPEPRPKAVCAVDDFGLPTPEPDLPPEHTCTPDPATGVRCAPTLTLRIPIHLGPQTTLWDLAFEGNTSFPSFALLIFTRLKAGEPLDSIELEAARKRVLDTYHEQGFAYAEVRTVIEPSSDRTRARVRFVINERAPVRVSGFVIHGATRTDHELILGRMALEVGEPYRKSWVRSSEERIATLGTFSSVAVSLEDPDIPQREKRVVITVVEQLPQYLDPRIGFSTGDGVRFAFEYGHRNIASQAISLTLRVQLSYLFDFMILDPEFKRNIAPLPVSQQLERRNSARVTFPEIGLGPLISFSVEGLDVRDNQRDFGLTKQALVPSVTYRPLRQISNTLAASVELNDVQLFQAETIDEAIKKNRTLENLLRVPDGRTFAIAQRLSFAWDRRDNPFAATEGTFVSSGVEHVNAFPAETIPGQVQVESHFLRLETRVAGYFRLSRKGMAIALSLAGGYNLQLNSESKTYPDRLFFLGGVDSIRAFLADTVVPEDVAQRILNPEEAEGEALVIEDVGIRGGDISLNPRAELRIPLNDTFQLGLFLDAGNLWVDPASINPLAMRFGAGPGVRINTPIGPLAFDYGINLQRRPWEDTGAFHFSIGLF